MRDFCKKNLSLLLVLVMMVTIVPLNIVSSATDETNAEQSVSYNATNAMGDIIQQAMESEAAESNGHFVQEVTIEGFIATALISAPNEATLIVAVYEENSGAMVTSGKADVNSETETVDVLLAECVMPEFFVVKAFLLDNENAAICKNYEGFEYTAAYQEFLAKTVFDFEEETIVNFDNSYDNNFAVVTDEAVNVKQSETKNILVTNDYENRIYVFENVDETIKSLSSGEVFYYEYGDGEEDYILTKIETIEIDGDTVIITSSDDFEISDFFSYIKIDTSKPNNEPELYTMSDFDDEQGNFDKKPTSETILVNKEYEESENVKVSFNGTLNLEFYIKFYYDFKAFEKDYYELTYTTTVSFEGSAELTAEAEKEFGPITIFEGELPIYPGLDAVVEVALKVNLSASLYVFGGVEFKVIYGARKIAGMDKENLSRKPSVTLKFDVDGTAAINIIPSASVGIKIIKVFTIEADVEADFEIMVNAKITDEDIEERKKHTCAMCIDGDIHLTISGNIQFSFGFDEDDQEVILDIDLFSVKKKLGDFYISFISNSNGIYSFLKFGWGECPNIKLKKIAGGICGGGRIWSLYEDGEFVVSGTGIISKDDISLSQDYWLMVKKVTISNGITSIGDYAFSALGTISKFTSVTIPDSVTSIGRYAFSMCQQLTNVEMGNGVKDIGDSAFSACTDLKDITIPAGASLGKSVFTICNNLKNVTLLGNITVADSNLFMACNNLTSLVVAEGVTSLTGPVFNNCSTITRVTIPASLTYVDGSFFSLISNISEVYYGGTEAQWKNIEYGSYSGSYYVNPFRNATIYYNYNRNLYSVMNTMSVSEPEVLVASADGAIVGNEYVILALRQIEHNPSLFADNLLYIGQHTATDSHISFNFIPVYDDVGMVLIVGDFGNGNEAVYANEWIPEFTATWDIDGKITTQTVVFGEQIISPDVPVKDGYYFAGWNPNVPETMPAKDMAFTATYVDKKISVKISMPEKRTISYKEYVILYADTAHLPKGAKIKWEVEGKGVSINPSPTGKSCVVTSESTGNVVIKAYLIDANGKVIKDENGKSVSDSEYFYSDANLWLRIVYFFKKIFGINQTVIQSVFKALR